MEKILFTLYINCHEVREVRFDGGTVRQILFDGEARGEVFNGRILDGGVDTQTINPDGSGTLSARYMLEGTDAIGKSCHMYIDNSAVIGDDITSPKCFCDSEALSWICGASLVGHMVNDEEGFKIVICSC